MIIIASILVKTFYWKFKERDSQMMAHRSTNWLLGDWTLVKPSMNKQNSQKKAIIDTTYNWQKGVNIFKMCSVLTHRQWMMHYEKFLLTNKIL